jgi:hypothetical protein
MNKAVMCIVDRKHTAESIVTKLKEASFADHNISVLFPDKTGTKDFAHENNTKAPEGAIAGVGAGGAVGGTLGLLVGIGALAIPGLGPLIAAGPLLAALSGAAAGAAVGGISGALIGMGIPEVEAKRYEGKIKGGNFLISVHVDSNDQEKRATKIFESYNASDVCTTGETAVPTPPDKSRSIHA